jgi:hypothetical protein
MRINPTVIMKWILSTGWSLYVLCGKIKRGEELFINYNAHPTDNTAVWFDAT